MGGGGFSAVLFDWRGTLFHDESDRDWILASAGAIGRQMAESEANLLAQALADVDQHPQVREARQQADCSLALHRAATLLQLRLAGFDPDLALAVWQRDGNPLASFPYPDTGPVLRTLRARGVRVGIISDLHYDLRPMFEHHGLANLVDTFTLSFQHGWQKPDPRLFEAALAALDVQAMDTLMVGDRPSRDAGGIAVGITTLLLPPVPNGARRGLDSVVRLVRAHEAEGGAQA